MNLLYEKESYEIRGACFWVWKEFGSAFKESIIDNALTEELIKRGLRVENQKRINIYYNEKKVGVYVPDKVVNDAVIIEVKSKPHLTNQDIKQFWHYLKGSEYKLGFLINFGEQLEIKRVVYDEARIREEISVMDPRGYQRGFTLMEIIVATSIFVVVFMALLALFNYTLKINRRSEALRQASQGMRSFVEFLVKEIRNGQVDYLVNNGTTNGQYINNDANVPCRPPGTPGGEVVSTITDTYYSKDNKLGLINIEGVEECFYLGKSDGSYIDTPGGAPVTFGSAGTSLTLAMVKAGTGTTTPQILNPPNLSIQKLMFLISPVCNSYMASVDDTPPGVGCKNFSQHRPGLQPVVTIFIKFLTKLPTGETVPIYYQTSVSTNKYDIPTP